MSSHISSRSRLERVLSGEKPDRVPVSLWRHFPVDDQTPEGLAKSTLEFQQHYQFDFIKVTPGSSFCLQDWGAEDRWTGDPEGTRDYVHRPISRPEDWQNLPVLDPRKGHLGDQIRCLKLILQDNPKTTPVIQTVFSPLAQAKNLVGGEELLVQMRKYPDAVHSGLKRITETTIRFIHEIGKTGVDGIFFACQHAQYRLVNREEFMSFSRYYDLQVLEASQPFWLNILHLHGEQVMFDEVTDYPVSVINWHDRNTPPDLKTGLQHFKGVACGGLRRMETMVLGTPDLIRAEAEEAIQQAEAKRFILGTGCVLPIIAPSANIMAARSAVDLR